MHCVLLRVRLHGLRNRLELTLNLVTALGMKGRQWRGFAVSDHGNLPIARGSSAGEGDHRALTF